MKKMLLAFAVMAFAAAAQAITLKWTTVSSNSAWVATTLTCSLIYAGDATTASMATAIDVALGNSEAYDVVGTVWAANPSAYNTGSVISTAEQYTTGVYYIIFTENGKYAATSVTAEQAAKAWIPDAGPIPEGSYIGPVTVADFTGTLVPVPEPTAWALLALGVAGLALRRRA